VVRLPASSPSSWRYFDNAAAFLFGAMRLHGRVVGLRVYHLNPGYQFGPLSIVVAQALREIGGTHVVLVAQLTFLVVGLSTLWLVADAASRVGAGSVILSRGAFLVVGGTFLVEWDHLAIDTLHIDDAIALACTAFAINAIARRSVWWCAALAIGAATAAKPWAIIFLPLLVAVPADRRRIAAMSAAFVGLIVWAPFVIADSNTLLATHYTTLNAPSSVLRLFGVHHPRTPRWDRLAQLFVALALGLVAVTRRRWEGVVLVAVAVRIMLDPSVNAYYTTGLVFGAVVWDFMRDQRRWPSTTITVALLLELPTLVALAPTLAAISRLAACVGAIVTVLGAHVREPGSPVEFVRAGDSRTNLNRRERSSRTCGHERLLPRADCTAANASVPAYWDTLGALFRGASSGTPDGCSVRPPRGTTVPEEAIWWGACESRGPRNDARCAGNRHSVLIFTVG
jgi:hypothetical protein